MFKTIVPIYMILCFLCVAGIANAQPSPQAGSVTLPVLSFMVDSAHRLRPLIGVAGAASIGAPLDLGVDLRQAIVPPDHDYILATNTDNSPLLLQIHGTTLTVGSVGMSLSKQPADQSSCDSGADALLPRRVSRSECSAGTASADQQITIDRIVLSPSGSAAALFGVSQGRVDVFGNLGQLPTFKGAFQVGQLGPVTALGISDDGRTMIVGVSDGDMGSLFVASLDQPARLVASLHHPSAVTFAHGSDIAIVADDAENRIYTVSGSQVFAIAGAGDGIANPVGIAMSNDNQTIFVGNAQTGSVTTIRNGTVAPPRPCNCTLTGLYPTNTDSVFRLTDFSGGPVLLFDASAAAPRILYVPLR